jgi:microcystin-dependent protein
MSWSRSVVNYGAHQKPTVGDTKTALIGEDHLGWIKCDGRLLSPDEYQNLFKVIGYAFGQAGPLFRLPDPAGRVLGMIGAVNPDNSDVEQGLTTRYMGGLSGEEMHTLVIPEIPSHTHTINTNTTGITSNTNAPSLGFAQRTGNNTKTASDSSSGELDLVSAANLVLTDPAHNHVAQNTGGSEPHNNIQPTLWLGNLFIYSGKTGFNRNGTYSGSFPYTANTNIY